MTLDHSDHVDDEIGVLRKISTWIIGFIGLKRTFERETLVNYLIMLGSFAVSLAFLSQALHSIPLSITYAVWAGIGTLGATLLGILLYRESASPMRITAMVGIVVTTVALRLIS